MNPMKIFLQFVLVLLVFGIVGYFVFAPKSSSTINYNLSPREASEAIAQFKFYDLNETVQPLAQWKGKVVVLNFWATWCPPCRAEIPGFIKLQKQYEAQGVQFVGIAIDQKSKVAAYAKETGMNYPVLLGDLAGIDLAKRIGNKEGGLPYTVLLDRNGNIVNTHLGAVTEENMEKEIKPLL